jgi:hypothetical protein
MVVSSSIIVLSIFTYATEKEALVTTKSQMRELARINARKDLG